nr:hypothetical protein [uncultured Romboutsia sp.]
MSAYYTLKSFKADLTSRRTIILACLVLGQFKAITAREEAPTEIRCYI